MRLREQAIVERGARHHVRCALGDKNHFFQSDAAAAAHALDPNERLDGEHHSGLEFIYRRAGESFADIGRLVGADAYAMADEQRQKTSSKPEICRRLE